MTINLLFLLYFGATSSATTVAKDRAGQASNSSQCEIWSKFLEPKCIRVNGGPGREERYEHALFWQLEILDRNGSSCPQGTALSLRVRAASCGGTSPVTYPVDILEPRSGETIRLNVKFVEGRNTYLNREFSEWIYVERKND
jgi:hypothetical protein